jgi:hypothetical protein
VYVLSMSERQADPSQADTASAGARELHDAIDADDGDRPSITEVNGTIARFEMAYSLAKGERHAFGPPLLQRVPSYAYCLFALAVVVVVVAAHIGSSNSALFRWVVEGDKGRPLPSAVLAFLIGVSGLGTMLRSYLRGVVVSTDGVEGRYLLPLGVPKVKKWSWPEIHRILMDDSQIMLELWDGRFERLPDVGDPKELRVLLEGIAAGRKMTVTKLEHIERTR